MFCYVYERLRAQQDCISISLHIGYHRLIEKYYIQKIRASKTVNTTLSVTIVLTAMERQANPPVCETRHSAKVSRGFGCRYEKVNRKRQLRVALGGNQYGNPRWV